MILGTLANMHIVWSTDQPDIIEIYNIFADAGKKLIKSLLYFYMGEDTVSA